MKYIVSFRNSELMHENKLFTNRESALEYFESLPPSSYAEYGKIDPKTDRIIWLITYEDVAFATVPVIL